MHNKIIVVSLGVIFAIGLFLMGQGITGMVVSGQAGVAPLCETSDSCEGELRCCPIYGEQKLGVCHVASMCERIWEVTKEQKELQIDFFKSKYFDSFYDRDRLSPVPNYTPLLGLIVIALSGITFFMYSKKYLFYAEKKKKNKK